MTRPTPTRRAVLRTAVGLGAGSVAGTAVGRGSRGGDDWSEFGYDTANTGHAPDNTGPTGPVGEQWAFETGGAVHTSPVIVDGTIYVPSQDGNLYALAAVDGTERWRFETGGPMISSPAVADGLVYAGSGDGNLYALAAADGTERWRFGTEGTVDASITVLDDTVYFGMNGSPDQSVYAVDATDGHEIWSDAGFGTGSGVAVADGTAYVGTGTESIRAYDAESGEQLWQFDTEGFVFSPPTVRDGRVYAGSNDDANTVYAVDAADGTELWRYETNATVGKYSVAATDGTIYVGNDADIEALDPSDGTVRWSARTGPSRGQVVADGTVYVSGIERLSALDAETGAVEWRFRPSAPSGSPLALASGRVYVGSSDGTVRAVSTVDGPGNSDGSATGSTDTGETSDIGSEPGTERRTGTRNPDRTATDRGVPTDSGSLQSRNRDGLLVHGLAGTAAVLGAGIGLYWWYDDGTDAPLRLRNESDVPLDCKLRCRTTDQVEFGGSFTLEAGATRAFQRSLPDDRFEIAVSVESGPAAANTFHPDSATVAVVIDAETIEFDVDE